MQKPTAEPPPDGRKHRVTESRHCVRRTAWQYVIAVLFVAAALLIRLTLNPVLGTSIPFAIFFLAIILVSWFCHLGPSVMSVLASTLLATYYFVPPQGSIQVATTADWIGQILFLGVSGVLIVLRESNRRSETIAESNRQMAIREREELRTTLMSLGDAVIVTDAAGRVTTLNPVAERLTGWKLADAIGSKIEDVYKVRDETTGEPIENPATKVLSLGGDENKTGAQSDTSGQTQTLDTFQRSHAILQNKDGSNSPIDDNAAPICDSRGRLTGVVLVFRDIAEQRHAERLVIDSELRFRHMADSSPALIWMSGIDKQCNYFNKPWLDFTGRTFAQEWGNGWVDGVHPEDRERCIATYEIGFDARQPFSMDYRRRRFDGEYRWLLDNGSPRYAADGNFLGYIGSCIDITERMKLEQTIREQKEWLRVTLASIGDGVITTDIHGCVTFLNPVAESLTLWTLHQAEGKPLENVFHIINESSREIVENPVKQVLKTNKAVELANHTLLIDRSGRERPIADSAAPIRDRDGNMLGVVLIFRDGSRHRDIEQRRAARLAVTQTLAETLTIKEAALPVLQAICQNLHWDVGMLWLVDSENEELGTFEVYSEMPLTLAKFEKASRSLRCGMDRTLPGRVWQSREPHWVADIRGDDDFVRAAVAAQVGIQGTFACPVYLGNRVLGVLEFFSREIRQPDDDLLELMTMLGGQLGQFIERVRAQERTQEHLHRLTDAERRLRFVADASRSLAMLVDPTTTLQRMASLAVPVFADWCAVHIPGKQTPFLPIALAHSDPEKLGLAEELNRRYPPAPDALKGVPQVMRTGVSEWAADITPDLVKQVAQDDEHLRLLKSLDLKSYICVPIKTKERVLGVISFVRAETLSRYTIEDLGVAEDLAHRTAIAMENERLYEELRDEHRRKDEFLAMLAHELRNPLAPISAGLEVMAIHRIEPRSVELMQEQVRHLVRLVDDLLDVSRIMRGRIQLRKEPVDMARVIHHAVEIVRPFIDSRHQILEVSVPAGPMMMLADPVRLTQVIINLLNNAAKYTPPGGHVWLTIVKKDNELEMSVSDDGTGIDASLLPRVFDLFTQADRSLERSQGGLGIGLTVVRNLIELHGGSVIAASQGFGKGSVFTVRLPVLPIVAPEPAKLTEGDSSMNQRNILVVDDHVAAAQMLALLLDKLGGHQVQIVHDGTAALEAAQNSPPEIILLDIGLPHINGYEVAEQLRKNPKLNDTLIVALTGYGADEDRKRSQEAGFDMHLVKPPSLADLRRVLSHPKLYQTVAE